MEYRIGKDKVLAFCSFMNMTSDAFDLKRISNGQDFIDQIILLFKDDHRIFNSFVYKIFDLRVRHSLAENYSEEGFKDDQPIEDLLPRDLGGGRLKKLESELRLIFPRPVLSKASFLVQLLLFLVPLALVIIALMIVRVEFLIVLYGVVKFGAVIFLISVPYIIGYFIFPRFFQASELLNVKTYHDLVQDLVLMNRYYLAEDDFKHAREELKSLIESL